MPLAVALQSALQNLKTIDRVRIVVADVGLASESRGALARLIEKADVEASIDFVRPKTDLISHFPTTRWHKSSMYVRLLLDELLPPEWSRVLYLDGDVVVRGDLGQLWRTPMNGNVALAVQDFRNPTVSHRHQLLRDVYLEKYGLSPETPYFNSGLMLIDRPAWQAEQIGPRSIAFLKEYSRAVEYGDQDALNGVLANRWGLLDPRWNLTLSALSWYGWPNHESEENRKKQAHLAKDPLVVHFTGASKPWHHLYRRTMAVEFFRYLLESGWFSPWKGRRWVWERRLAHFLLGLMSDELLTTARDRLSKWRS